MATILALNWLHPSLTGVHGKDFVVAEELASVLLELAKHGVVEGSRGERDLGGLLVKSLNYSGMTMTLVDSTVGAQEVKVTLAIHIPHEDAWNGEKTLSRESQPLKQPPSPLDRFCSYLWPSQWQLEVDGSCERHIYPLD